MIITNNNTYLTREGGMSTGNGGSIGIAVINVWNNLMPDKIKD